MDLCLREDRSSEETLELRIPEGMPDAGKILASWGQPLLRSKEWRSDRIVCTAGMMVWVLYQPESGGEPQCLDGWVGQTLRWDLPRDCPEGDLRIDLATRFVDARMLGLVMNCTGEEWGQYSRHYYTRGQRRYYHQYENSPIAGNHISDRNH